MMRRIFRENGLSIVMLGMALAILVGLSFTGFRVYNNDRSDYHQPAVTYTQYLESGHFIEAVFENWESEFLQMGSYVFLTAFLFQKGSPESKKLDEQEAVDADPREKQNDPNAPWPVRRGGWILKLYEHSLSIALMLLFLISFVLHGVGGAESYSEEQQRIGQPPVSTLEYFGSSQFWFESLENWQSEFLSVGAVVVFSIYLRERGSPESKPVASPHTLTGED